MLTIFSIPKGFNGHFEVIQSNAINSWKRLKPECEIILFGDDPGIAEIARELCIHHVPEVEKNEQGTPLLGAAFNIAQGIGQFDKMLYVNSDIILFDEIIRASEKIEIPEYLVCGRRVDLDIDKKLNFSESNWVEKLRIQMSKDGVLHGYSGIDYFMFNRGLITMPPFAVGRPGWDNWLIYNIKQRNVPVIDATDVIPIIHQNHDYSHSKFGKKERVSGPELTTNLQLAGGHSNLLSIRDLDWLLTEKGIQKVDFSRMIYSRLSGFVLWRKFLGFKRYLTNFLQD